MSEEIPPYVAGVMAAAKRASRQAIETAIQTGTGCVLLRDGKLEHVSPEQLLKDNSGQWRIK